ncbi:MAG TPA: histidine phosphatase family protein [Candidatus Lachnoclostridium pullistercoris]|uniref:Histidine phosphatase family protein n=1 Tax=Candidatus Lachnoclostridium pullistercoris TaxID=2838632 RepID=A0A9D2T6S5_9FIRM|nr:histidine phosphatase family protein [Candidatus Lachnoclostridium pullistercoris]
MRLYLIRHGQTDWNVAGKIQGCHDIPLNETGKKQAQYLAEGMKKRPVTHVYSSPQIRALETARAIAASQGVEVTAIPGLREVEFGDWEGMTWGEIKERDPERYARWVETPAEVTPPGGESRAQIYERIGDAVSTIIKEAKGDVAVVSHGAALVYAVSYMFRNEVGPHDEIIVKNVSITTVEYDRETGHFRMIQENDLSHLPPEVRGRGSESPSPTF